MTIATIDSLMRKSAIRLQKTAHKIELEASPFAPGQEVFALRYSRAEWVKPPANHSQYAIRKYSEECKRLGVRDDGRRWELAVIAEVRSYGCTVSYLTGGNRASNPIYVTMDRIKAIS